MHPREIRDFFANAGLQFRMTLIVTLAVLTVSTVVLVITASFIREEYETMLDERISDDLAAITRVMEQRMLRVEGMTRTVAALACESLDEQNGIDSLLFRCMSAMDDIQGVSIIFDKGYFPGIDGFYERYSWFDEGKIRIDTYINGDELLTDEDWVCTFLNGDSVWGDIANNYMSDFEEMCFFVPLHTEDGKRIGMTYTSILASALTKFVTEYKVRKDIDISIYKLDGTLVVAPDDYILKLNPDDMIVRESFIEHLGWKVVLSADRRIIHRVVNRAMVSLLLIFVLMFVVISLVIRLTVKYVANPFIKKQRQVEKEKALVDNELQLAAAAQREIVPHTFPPFPDRKEIDLFACLHPARNIGGDMYDYFLVGDRLYFCIGDVSGKGLQASLFMAATHYLFRSVADGMPASDAVRQINISLCSDNEKCRFVTFWFGCLDLSDGNLVYVNAGHDSPILVHGGKADTLSLSENMPLGALDEAEFISKSIHLEPGDILLLYTDGITEAMDAQGHEFGRKKLLETVRAASSGPTDSTGLIESVLSSVRQHACGAVQSDDITMLCLKYVSRTETKS